MIDISEHVTTLAERLYSARQTDGTGRLIMAIAGAPASGKSTLAEELNRRLNAQKCRSCVVPMDGFHLDNAILSELDLLHVKGAPQTFDAMGFLTLMGRMKGRSEVVYPVFDRARDIAIAGAGLVDQDTEVVIVEGNYLLLDRPPWSDLARIWDLTVSLNVPLPELRARLIQRWLSHGLSRTAATRRAEANDIPNAELVQTCSNPADFAL